MCASDPEPEPEPTAWEENLKDRLEHEDWQASCMEEDYAVRGARDNEVANGWEADEEILDIAWRHEDPGSASSSSGDDNFEEEGAAAR